MTGDSSITNTERGARPVSVIIPTHQRRDSLRAVLGSLQRQQYPHEAVEVIVVASEGDEAFSLVRDVGDRSPIEVRCVAIPDDPARGRNPAAKRNFGVEQARGHWIAFVDDDCLAHPDWIANASKCFEDSTVGGVEGQTEIPAPPTPTLTYKGMLAFTRPGGYQTCNMFYRRDVFLQIGGFDTRFPFYLEDTDLAWSVLDAGYQIPYAQDARVTHPVPPAAPWRLWDDAARTDRLALLRAKHPERFRSAAWRILRASHNIYLLIYVIGLAALVAGSRSIALGAGAALVVVTIADAVRRFRGCRVGFAEVVVTTALLPLVPLVRLVQYARGRLRYARIRPT